MNAIDVLTDARSRGVAWPIIAGALDQLTVTGNFDAEGRPWIEVAAHLTGYTTSQLRLGQRTFKSIQDFISSNNTPSHSLYWPMSILETIVRISKANLVQARHIISDLNQPTLREIRVIYDSIRENPDSSISPMSSAHRSARMFKKSLFISLSNKFNLRSILQIPDRKAVGVIKKWPGGFPFANPDFFVEFAEEGKVKFAAFEGARIYGDVNSMMAVKLVTKTAFESTFFSRYYWCTPSWTPTDELKYLKNQLDLNSVGLISISDDNPKILVQAFDSPMPDRQSMLLQNAKFRQYLTLI